MVVTEKFVYIHMPKTGGTFVTAVLERLHHRVQPQKPHSHVRRIARSVARLTGIRRVNAQRSYGPILNLEPKHGTCHDIPSHLRHLPILSTIRNPYDWYVSQYEFGWWKKTFLYQPEVFPTPVGKAIERVLPSFIQENPTFPEIPFESFMALCEQAARIATRGADLGLYTFGFFGFFHREPDRALRSMKQDCRGTLGMPQELFQVEFMVTHHLNEQLRQFLLAAEYHPNDLGFIPELGRILPMGRGRREDQPWQEYYTSDLKSTVRHWDRLLFEKFPEFDDV